MNRVVRVWALLCLLFASVFTIFPIPASAATVTDPAAFDHLVTGFPFSSTDLCEACHVDTGWVRVTAVAHVQVNGPSVSCHV